MARAALGLGSNIGDKRGAVAEAIARLESGGIRVLQRSSDYRTEPWGLKEQDWFVNACVIIETALSPQALLDLCLVIERAMGRIRELKWGPRIIDIDILAYDEVALDTPTLTLPHPHLFERAFVLVPLAEIAPDLVIGGTRVADAQARLGSEGVTRLEE
jgi:2-amino-4-hydroxy-6-hydroxymethyldihydropteridine diphosphokinase